MSKELKNHELEKHVVVKIQEVVMRTALSKASIYAFIKEGRFPKPIPLGSRSVGWSSIEIDEWILSRIEKRDQGLQVAV